MDLTCDGHSSSGHQSNSLAGLLTIWCPEAAIHNSSPGLPPQRQRIA